MNLCISNDEHFYFNDPEISAPPAPHDPVEHLFTEQESYYLAEERDGEDESSLDTWLQAEEEVNQLLRQDPEIHHDGTDGLADLAEFNESTA